MLVDPLLSSPQPQGQSGTHHFHWHQTALQPSLLPLSSLPGGKSAVSLVGRGRQRWSDDGPGSMWKHMESRPMDFSVVTSGSEPRRERVSQAESQAHTCGRLCTVPIAKGAGRSSPGPRELVGLKALVASSCQAGKGDLGTEEMSTGGWLAVGPVYSCSLLADLAQQWVPSPWLTQHTGNPQPCIFALPWGPTFLL